MQSLSELILTRLVGVVYNAEDVLQIIGVKGSGNQKRAIASIRKILSDKAKEKFVIGSSGVTYRVMKGPGSAISVFGECDDACSFLAAAILAHPITTVYFQVVNKKQQEELAQMLTPAHAAKFLDLFPNHDAIAQSALKIIQQRALQA